jgi:hypothetical protein
MAVRSQAFRLGITARFVLAIAAFSVTTVHAAVPPNARIPSEFVGVWADQVSDCEQPGKNPTYTLSPRGFEGLPGEKAYPKVKKLDQTGRHIQVSFYNSNGPLSWRSIEYFRLSADGNKLQYRFAGGTFQWVRCYGAINSLNRKSVESGD